MVEYRRNAHEEGDSHQWEVRDEEATDRPWPGHRSNRDGEEANARDTHRDSRCGGDCSHGEGRGDHSPQVHASCEAVEATANDHDLLWGYPAGAFSGC